MSRAGRALVCIFVFAASEASGQVTPGPPLTPGSVVLLANQSAEPTLDRRPVPVAMSVTVNFVLQ